MTLKSYNISDEVIETWSFDTVRKVLQIIRKIEKRNKAYSFDVADYSRLINLKPVKKDGSADSAMKSQAVEHANKIREMYIERPEKIPNLVDYFTRIQKITRAENEEIKDYLKHFRTLVRIINLLYLCSNSDQS